MPIPLFPTVALSGLGKPSTGPRPRLEASLSLIIFSSLISLSATPAAAATNLPPSDPNIRYIGRWDRTSPDVYHSYWSGAYFRTKFTGTSVGLKLGAQSGLAVSIDGEVPRTLGGNGTLALNASPLKPGEHTLQVGSAGQNEEVVLNGLVLDDGAKAEPCLERPIIEFVGDSITQGNHSYAWDAAEMLGCDHVQIAFSARALTTGYGCAKDKAGLDQQFFLLKNFNHLEDKPQVPWNFSYTPNLVVINLGQNDQCGSEPGDTMQKSYVSFLQKVRSKYPNVPIVALRPFSGAFAKEINAAVDEVVAGGDTHCTFIDTTGWLIPSDFVDGIHPHYNGALIAGHKLASALSPILNR
jgi:hypothetical protein